MAHCSDNMRVVFEMCYLSGQRIGDVLRMRWDDIEEGGIWVRQGKTRARLWVPLTPTLAATLAETPRNGMTIITTLEGRPLAYRSAHEAVMEVRRQIDAEAHDLHGLRYSAASELAAAGCTDEQIEAITGHATVAMIRRYAGPARQKARATEAQKTRR
jgi:integrase